MSDFRMLSTSPAEKILLQSLQANATGVAGPVNLSLSFYVGRGRLISHYAITVTAYLTPKLVLGSHLFVRSRFIGCLEHQLAFFFNDVKIECPNRVRRHYRRLPLCVLHHAL